MAFGFNISILLLFIASMVFIIGYIFGGFAKRPVLASLSKIAAILVIVLFIATNAFWGVLLMAGLTAAITGTSATRRTYNKSKLRNGQLN